MQIDEAPPPGWDDGLAFPTLSTAFARASCIMGQRALFASDGPDRALVLLRSLPGPLVRAWTMRAKVYVDAGRPHFVPALVRALRGLGVSYARLGDSVWGLPSAVDFGAGGTTVTTHLMAFDATVGEEEAWARMEPKIRSQIRKSERERVRVDEIRDAGGLDDFCALVDETRRRMHARHVASAVPHAFFRAVWREMVPRGDAVFLVARARTRPLAAALFLVSAQRMSYYLGASTRDRALTGCNGPTALFWHAMRLARERGTPHFDLGAVTPTDDRTHPHHSVYRFKRAFGGRLEEMRSSEVRLSPLKCRFQEFVVLPVWSRLYPYYLRLAARKAVPVRPLEDPVRDRAA